MNLLSFRRLVGKNIRQARYASGLTQEQVAAKATTLKNYAELERGRGNPTLETLFIVARALDVAPAALLITDAKRTGESYARICAATEPTVKPGRKSRQRTAGA